MPTYIRGLYSSEVKRPGEFACYFCLDFDLFFVTGYYAYIEASSPRKWGDQAKLEIRPPLGNGPTCITFYYHMKGKDIGQLIVSVNGKQRFRKSGSQGDTWKKADLKVQERANVVSTLCGFILHF